MSSAPNIIESVAKYESFINDVLKEDLRLIDLRLQQLNQEISELIQQKHTFKIVADKQSHPDGFKTQVNIGCNFFMEASVTDTQTVLFNIGLNHFLEFSIEEAKKYLDVRIKAFEAKANELNEKAVATKAHIKLMLLGINQLQTTDS